MKKALKNSICILLLAISLAVTQIPVTEVAADTAASDFQMNGSLLVKYTGTSEDVSIPTSVTRIGDEAFADSTHMQKVYFKDKEKITKIGYRAFAGCTDIRQFDTEDCVMEIDSGAFSNCSSMQAFYIGKQLRKIGMGVFAGCTSLRIMMVDKDNPNFTVEDGCLYNKDKTKLYLMLPGRDKDTYSMPATVADIAEYAFWGCNSMKSISLSGSLKSIPDYAFSNCKSLESVSLPYSVTEIGIQAFADCVNLKNVYIPPAVKNIHATAFDGCIGLVIKADSGSTAEQYYTDWKKSHSDQSEYEDTGNSGAEDTEEEQGSQDGTSGCQTGNDGTQGEVSGSGKVLGTSYIVGNKAMVFIDNTNQKVYGASGAAESESNSVSQEMEDGEETPNLTQLGGKATELAKYTVVDGRIIADQAFYLSKEVSGYAIPEGITEIGEFSFARSNLEKAVLPKGTATIGYGAFYHCDTLREVKLPDTVTYIAPRAFEKSLWLQNWIAEGKEEYLVVGDGILLAYKGKGGDIILPEEVKQIGPGVFQNNITVRSVTFPKSLTVIGEDAFAGCRGLTAYKGGENITDIKDRAFAGCAFTTFHVPQSVQRMGLRVIDYSSTNRGISGQVVVFDGDGSFPAVSHEATAQRLSNEADRGLALEQVAFAILRGKVSAEELEGTVLDASENGFEGIIAYISSREPKKITCLVANMTREELEAAYIPQYVSIDGANYLVEGQEKVICAGKEAVQEEGTLTVVNTDNKLAGEGTTAQLEGNTGEYALHISDDPQARKQLAAAYEAVYRTALPDSAPVAELTLVDRNVGIPVTKLGNRALSVTIPVPKGTKGNIRIFTADRNGQLENVPFTLSEDGSMLTFRTTHLSPFALCSNVVNVSALDISPDTGDTVHPKWFFAVGLASLSMILFFTKTKKTKKAI